MSTLKSLTKVELIALISARDAEIAGLRMKLSVAERNTPRTYVASPPSAASIAFRANLAAARDLAMRTGACVKVEHA
jgi:hypothetical protein